MSLLVDTTICPDCRGALDPSAACTVCGLQVTGPLALQLWNVMVTADRLIEQLRIASATTPVIPRVATPTGDSEADRTGSAAPLPTYPVPAAAARQPAAPRRLPAASVQVVLLSLGGLCLLVAAVVFAAVAWNVLGLTGRALVLLGVTSVLAVVAVLLTRKGLRGAAETFWLIVAGMLTVDLLAAQAAGLAGLDSLSWRGTSALVGGALLALGTGVGMWARRQPVTRLYGAESVAALGALVLCSSNAWFAENPAIATTLSIPVLAGLLVLLRRPVPLAAYGLGGVGVASWLVLVGLGWDRALETVELGAWWSEVRGWPLVAAAVFAAAATQAPGVPARVRPVLAGLALFPLVLLVRAPLTEGTATRDRLIDCAALVALASLAALSPRVWARGAAALTSLGTLALGLALAIAPWDVLQYLDPDGRSGATLLISAPEDNAASWTFALTALALVTAGVCLLRQVPAAGREVATGSVVAVGAAALSLGGLVLVLELQPPLWSGVLAGVLGTTVAGGAAWWTREHVVAAALGSSATAYLSLVTLYAASANSLLIALTATALALSLMAGCVLREGAAAPVSAAMLGALGVLLGGWGVVEWGQVMDGDLTARLIALAVYAALVAVLAPPATRHLATRVSLEASAATLAVLAVATAPDDRTAALVLTIIGTAICVIAVTTRDRALLGWVGAAVLGLATAVRVVADVRAPELYTLPAAALLVAAGVWQLRRDPRTSSFTMLGSGLTLALLPSLLLALEEPVSLRGALIGAAAVLTLAAGVQQRLATPFVLGAVTTGVLAVRHLEPIADAVPRWISLGGLGLVLLVVGITWEARRRNLETAQRYLTALR